MLFLSFYLIFLGFTKYHFRKARCQNPQGEKRLQEAFGDTFREMILSDKADLLHVEKVHLALRGREEKKKKRYTYKSHSSSKQHLFTKKVGSKKRERQIFSAFIFEKEYLQVSFSTLLACDFSYQN